jgi:diacylglycerol O-acyltransferase
VKAATAAMKSTMGGIKSVLPTDFPSIGVPWLMEALTGLYGRAKVADRIPLVANVVISNVPGPPVPLFMAGARMLSNYPTSIVAHGMALNITVQSYDQQMDFGLMADAAAMPDVRSLADALLVAFDDLCLLDDEVNAPPTLADTGRAMAGQARQRLSGGLGQVGHAVSTAITQAMGSAAKGAVASALGARRATGQHGGVRGVLRGVVEQAVAAVSPKDAGNLSETLPPKRPVKKAAKPLAESQTRMARKTKRD